ncbi:MAG: hypothetical protein KAR07_06250 [Spirochaetes bacterium]|nr:hypothetical protein [Spirochaetota bacterium]
MKKLLVLLFFLVFASFTMSAEFALDQGAKKIGGTISYDSYGGNLYGGGDLLGDTTIITIAPGFGYFLAKGLCLNFDIELVSQSSGTDSLSYLFGPGLDYFFGAEKGKNVVYFIGTKVFYGKDDDGRTYLNGMFNIGSAFFLDKNKHASIDLTANFYLVNKKISAYGGYVSGTIIRFGVGLSIYLF